MDDLSHEGLGEIGLGETTGEGNFVGAFDCVVEVGGDLGEVVAVIPVEVSYGFE